MLLLFKEFFFTESCYISSVAEVSSTKDLLVEDYIADDQGGDQPGGPTIKILAKIGNI